MLWTKYLCSPKILVLKSLTPMWWYQEVGLFGRWLDHRGEPSWLELVPLWKGSQRALTSVHLGRTQQGVKPLHLERKPHQNPSLLAADLKTCSLQSWETSISVVYKPASLWHWVIAVWTDGHGSLSDFWHNRPGLPSAVFIHVIFL